MLDFRSIFDVVIEEAHASAARVQFNDGTVITELKDKLANLAPLPPATAGATVIEEVFWASLLTEEGRPTRVRLTFEPGPDYPPPVRLLRERMALNRQTLRKVSPAQGDGALIWNTEDDAPRIAGFRLRRSGIESSLVVEAAAPGAFHVDWELNRLVTFRGGELTRLSKWQSPSDTPITSALWQYLGSHEIRNMQRVVRTLSSEGHGGAVWIVPVSADVTTLNRGYIIDRELRPQPRNPKSNKLSDMGLLETRAWYASIADLAAVDGAVLVDSALHVLAFGTFVPLREGDSPIHWRKGDGVVVETTASKLGGGRHRSAVDFCRSFERAAAVVVSEDGRVMWILGNGIGTPPTCIERARVGDTYWLSPLRLRDER